jgi:UDP-N-acetylmuramoyl-tripeptide--D-alanyl-D-alanine ligase
MAGQVVGGDSSARWTRATLDSRQVAGGELFFALRGERVDGHDFAGDALARGAAAAVVERDVTLPALPPLPEGARGGLIRVPAVYDALHALTRAVRREVPERLLAITGSSGKTTTKELLALCLERRYRVAKSPGNLNNLLGFPLALLGTEPGTEWLVAEMGMSLPGELAQLSRLARPDVALFTNVRPVHLEGLGSLEAIAHAKGELLEGLDESGTVVVNHDDPWVRWIGERHPGRKVWYSPSGAAPYSLAGVAPRQGGTGTAFRLVTPEGEVEVELPLHGAYNAENFLAAAAAAHALGVPLAELPAAAAGAAPTGGRGAVLALGRAGSSAGGGFTVVDDSYNSNPVALRRALESARALPGARHWAVLGDMLELGPDAPRFHRDEGEAAAALGFAPVVGVGELARHLADGAAAAGARSEWFAGADEAAAFAASEARDGDVVLVKGSRGVRLERVVAALRAAAGEAGDVSGGAAH